VIVTGLPSLAQDVRIGVLGLFHPREIVIRAAPASAVVVRAGDRTLVLERSTGVDEIDVHLDNTALTARTRDDTFRARSLTIVARDNGPADFFLSVPGKITRRYRGTLSVMPVCGSLVTIVSIDLETAVASIVAAESDPDTPLEALKAQAIATRSYLIAAKGRHHDFDFCDTTHCQFLRTPPAPNTRAALAVSATRGMVLVYGTHTFAPMYTRSCSGRTRTPAEVGLPAGPYPYYSVDCKYCRQHASAWERHLTPPQAVRLNASSEAARLDLDRVLGWSTVPSNNFTMKRAGNRVLLEGFGEGHGIGLCQSGAAAMAKEGATFGEILAHYYPNTSVTMYAGPNR
jgi:peptidoglycan hydrolase-like amidase